MYEGSAIYTFTWITQNDLKQSRWGHHYGETWSMSSPSSTRAPETDMSRPGFDPATSWTAEGHSSKELLQQTAYLIDYSEPLQYSR